MWKQYANTWVLNQRTRHALASFVSAQIVMGLAILWATQIYRRRSVMTVCLSLLASIIRSSDTFKSCYKAIGIPLTIQCVAWPLTFLYTQTAIVSNTKWFSVGEGKLPLKLAVLEIEPRPFFLTRSFRQSCKWKVVWCKTADIFWRHWNCLKWGETSISLFRYHRPLRAILSTKQFFANGTEPSHVNSLGAECRLRKRLNVACLMLLARFIQDLSYIWSPDPRGEK